MSDSLLSLEVGTTFAVASTVLITYACKKIKDENSMKRVPLMGVLSAFVFAAQMINFSIPGTGSSGHIGGGILLSAILGPFAGLVSLASVLIIQALFFADGGILALGTNIFNLGVIPAFFGILIYRNLIKESVNRKKLFLSVLIATVVSLEIGALMVAFQTSFSNISELPFKQFSYVMLLIHFPIALIESFVTYSVIMFLYEYRSDLISTISISNSNLKLKKSSVIAFLLAAFIIVGGFISWFASENPDGLEWSIFKINKNMEVKESENRIIKKLGEIQGKTAFLPDYNFSKKSKEKFDEKLGTSISGILGGIFLLIFVYLFSMSIKLINKESKYEKVKSTINN